eukprot:scaffold12108_cov97-Isochrysis_galbana.AAC.3
MRQLNKYTPPKVWKYERPSGGAFAAINAPTAGAREQKELEVCAATCTCRIAMDVLRCRRRAGPHSLNPHPAAPRINPLTPSSRPHPACSPSPYPQPIPTHPAPHPAPHHPLAGREAPDPALLSGHPQRRQGHHLARGVGRVRPHVRLRRVARTHRRTAGARAVGCAKVEWGCWGAWSAVWDCGVAAGAPSRPHTLAVTRQLLPLHPLHPPPCTPSTLHLLHPPPLPPSTAAQFTSGFVDINPNSKIPAMLDTTTSPPTRVFESAAILIYLAEKYSRTDLWPSDLSKRAEVLSWLMWQMGSAPYLGGGYGHFYKYAPFKMEYAINRFTMETKRQLDVLNQLLASRKYIAGENYSLADIAIWPW